MYNGINDIGELVGYNGTATQLQNSYISSDVFYAKDLGDAFVDDDENVNGGYPLLYWE